MPDPDIAEVERLARQAFAFLEDGMEAAIQTRKQPFAYTTVTYVLNGFAVEVSLDWHDRSVNVSLCLVQDGVVPQPAQRAQGGRLVRMYLNEALARAGKESHAVGDLLVRELRENARDTNPARAMPRRIELWANALRVSITDVSSHVDAIFPEIDGNGC